MYGWCDVWNSGGEKGFGALGLQQRIYPYPATSRFRPVTALSSSAAYSNPQCFATPPTTRTTTATASSNLVTAHSPTTGALPRALVFLLGCDSAQLGAAHPRRRPWLNQLLERSTFSLSLSLSLCLSLPLPLPSAACAQAHSITLSVHGTDLVLCFCLPVRAVG